MATHHHHEHHGADLARAAEATLTKAGEQWTPMRAHIFQALAGFDKPASAYDIADAVSQREGRRIAANSVYRILDLFVGANRRGASKAPTPMSPTRTPIACTTASSWCDTCGQTTHIDDDTITRTVYAAAKGAGFSPERLVIEVRGKCADCDWACAGRQSSFFSMRTPGTRHPSPSS